MDHALDFALLLHPGELSLAGPLVDQIAERVRSFLLEHQGAVERLAAALVDHTRLGYRDAVAIMRDD